MLQSPLLVRVARIAVVGALLGAALALSACGSTTGGASAASSEPPTVKLVTPLDGSEVAAGQLEVKVEATNLKFTMAGNKNVPGEGHVHVTLDDRPFIMSIEPTAKLEDVAPGSHKLEVELVQNNTQSFDPPVKQEIEFTAK